MNATKQTFPWKIARSHAQEIVDLLEPYSERIIICGSLRRLKADVHDIEILVDPKLEARTVSLFGDVEAFAPIDQHINLLLSDVFSLRLDKNGRSAIGPRYKRLSYQGIPFDLFIRRDSAQYGLLLAIRTGPADFSHKLVTSRLHGGCLPIGWKVQDGALWNGPELVETPDERDVFAVLGMAYIEPEARA